MRNLVIALSLALATTASAQPRKAKSADPEVAALTGKLKLARAKGKVTKAQHSAANAIVRADAAIERCEQAIVDLCVLEAEGFAPGKAPSCEDTALASRFASCHSVPRKPGWLGAMKQRYPKVSQDKLIAYHECLSEVEADDDTSAAERCAGELE